MILQICFMYFACGNYCTATFLSKNIAQNKLKTEQEHHKSLKKKEAFENYLELYLQSYIALSKSSFKNLNKNFQRNPRIISKSLTQRFRTSKAKLLQITIFYTHTPTLSHTHTYTHTYTRTHAHTYTHTHAQIGSKFSIFVARISKLYFLCQPYFNRLIVSKFCYTFYQWQNFQMVENISFWR